MNAHDLTKNKIKKRHETGNRRQEVFSGPPFDRKNIYGTHSSVYIIKKFKALYQNSVKMINLKEKRRKRKGTSAPITRKLQHLFFGIFTYLLKVSALFSKPHQCHSNQKSAGSVELNRETLVHLGTLTPGTDMGPILNLNKIVA